jgi:DNA mismatch endonuclease (patch repair protein)
MSRVRSFDNGTTELRLAALLRQNRITGWRRHPKLLGRPDFVFGNPKLAVFVDGCFWHGHNCRNLTARTNAHIWLGKLTRTRKRDRRITAALRDKGWSVIRIWECALNKSPQLCLVRLRSALSKARRRTRVQVME